jgi:single-strand DNA-binding protein
MEEQIMNKLTIIGNLTKDPEKRTTTSGVNVCSFSVAVNKPKRDGQDQGADFFRVTAWRGLADICAKYLAKGRKVAVVGSVSLHTYQSNGETKASMEVNADDVEFLTPKGDGMTPVNDPDDPFGGLN